MHFDKPEGSFETIVIRKVSCATAIAVSPVVREVGSSGVIDNRDTVEFDLILGSLLHHEVVQALESHFLGDIHGQVFVFFILTVAAAESAIGLAILVVMFRNQDTINVDELNSMKG